MVIDAAKGIEAQTRKLFEVCRMRDIPILTFINKMDRKSRDPLDLLDEIEKACARHQLNWPVGRAASHRLHRGGSGGVLLLEGDAVRAGTVRSRASAPFIRIPESKRITQPALESLGALPLNEPSPRFDAKAFREGHLSPVIFGSALKDFGVGELLACLGALGAGCAAAQDNHAHGRTG